jgi:hypothetical protein
MILAFINFQQSSMDCRPSITTRQQYLVSSFKQSSMGFVSVNSSFSGSCGCIYESKLSEALEAEWIGAGGHINPSVQMKWWWISKHVMGREVDKAPHRVQ